jgi:hypothetical protein
MAEAVALDSAFVLLPTAHCRLPTPLFGLRISFHPPPKLESFVSDELIRCCGDALPIETQGGEPFRWPSETL